MCLSHYGKATSLPFGAEMVVAKIDGCAGCQKPRQFVCPGFTPGLYQGPGVLKRFGCGRFWVGFLGNASKKSLVLVEMLIGKTCLETCWGILQEPEFY